MINSSNSGQLSSPFGLQHFFFSELTLQNVVLSSGQNFQITKLKTFLIQYPALARWCKTKSFNATEVGTVLL